MNIINGQTFWMVAVVDDDTKLRETGEDVGSYGITVYDTQDEALVYIRETHKEMKDIFVLFECKALLTARPKLEVKLIKKGLPNEDE